MKFDIELEDGWSFKWILKFVLSKNVRKFQQIWGGIIAKTEYWKKKTKKSRCKNVCKPIMNWVTNFWNNFLTIRRKILVVLQFRNSKLKIDGSAKQNCGNRRIPNNFKVLYVSKNGFDFKHNYCVKGFNAFSIMSENFNWFGTVLKILTVPILNRD